MIPLLPPQIQAAVAAAQLVSRLLGGARSAAQLPAQAPGVVDAGNPPAIDPAILSAILATAQRPPEPVPEVRLPRSAAVVASIVIIGFFALLAAIAGLLLFGDIERFSAALAVLCVGFGVLASKFGTVVDFLFGSSWGSRTKDALRPPKAPGTPIILSPVITPAPPVVEPIEPVEPSVDPTEPSVGGIGRSTDPSTATNRQDLPVTSVPASIRYNNPGAQYPSERAAAFGQLGYGIIGGGHKIALFPSPVNGAAANFDLLSRNYTGMTIGAAGDKWTGGNGFGVPGYDPNQILTKDMVRLSAPGIALLKAIAKREAGRDSPLTDEQWAQAHAMFLTGSADVYLNVHQGTLVNTKPVDLAAAIVAAMLRKNYTLDTKPGEVNIVYVEGLSEDGTINDDAPDRWNDLRVAIGFDGERPVVLGKWAATTEPGKYYTDNPVNTGGAARIEFGQYTAWRVGMHRGNHLALVQRGPVTVCRDLNRDMMRTGDARDTGSDFGLNQHGGYDTPPDSVGKASAGCLVGRTMAGHGAFMAIVQSDPRFVADPDFLFRTAILAEKDVVQT